MTTFRAQAEAWLQENPGIVHGGMLMAVRQFAESLDALSPRAAAWRESEQVKVMRNLIATQMGHEHLADHHDLLDELCDAIAACAPSGAGGPSKDAINDSSKWASGKVDSQPDPRPDRPASPSPAPTREGA